MDRHYMVISDVENLCQRLEIFVYVKSIVNLSKPDISVPSSDEYLYIIRIVTSALLSTAKTSFGLWDNICLELDMFCSGSSAEYISASSALTL
jgi:hypothetical protein